jgi:sugar lactone lactonase YvrE
MATSSRRSITSTESTRRPAGSKLRSTTSYNPTASCSHPMRRSCTSWTAASRRGRETQHISGYSTSISARGGHEQQGICRRLRTGLTDGVRCDAGMSGAPWVGDSKEDGVRCYSPQGELLGKIHLPDTAGNLTFGGMLRNRRYMCASTSIRTCYVDVQSAMKS